MVGYAPLPHTMRERGDFVDSVCGSAFSMSFCTFLWHKAEPFGSVSGICVCQFSLQRVGFRA